MAIFSLNVLVGRYVDSALLRDVTEPNGLFALSIFVYFCAKLTHLGHKPWWLRFQRWLDKGAYEDYYVLFKQKNEQKH